MAENKNGNPRPDGWSVGIPLGPVGVGGTWYRNPGSPTAPFVTVTGGLGMGGGGIQAVFLRKGRTSSDTLGYGVTGTASTGFPFFSSIHDGERQHSGCERHPGNGQIEIEDTIAGFVGFILLLVALFAIGLLI